MVSSRDRCRPSRSCLPGVMKIIPTTIWLSKSFRQPLSTAIYIHQQSFSATELKTILPAIIRPPHNSETIRASLKARQDYSWYDAHSSYQPIQFGYRRQFPIDGTQMWSKPKHRHPSPTSSRHHKANTGENCSHLKEADISTTVPEPVNTSCNTKVPL